MRVRDVARVELGAQTYNTQGRLNGRPGVLIMIYQLPGSNALATMKAATKLMEEAKARFPEDLEYVTALDTTLAMSAGIESIVHTLFEALALVLVVVFIFLQGFRATLIPMLAVPVSLVGTFALFPLLGFSINTLSLFGLVLAIGLVVDDAIVVVEAVEHHIEQGLAPRAAAFKAMERCQARWWRSPSSWPPCSCRRRSSRAHRTHVSAVRGDHRRGGDHLGLHRAVAEPGALGAAPAAAAGDARAAGVVLPGLQPLVRPGDRGYVGACGHLIRKSAFSMLLLVVVTGFAGLIGSRLPGGFVPDEDQGYLYFNVQLPLATSLQRTAAVNDKLDAIFKETPGIKYYTGVSGFSLLSFVFTTYNSFYFITLEDWEERDKHGLTADVIMRDLNRRLAGFPTRRRSPSPRPSFQASARPAASRSCWRTAPAGTRRSWRRTPRSSSRPRASGPSSPCSSPRCCRACRSSSRTWTGTRCSSRASTWRRSTRPCRRLWAASS